MKVSAPVHVVDARLEKETAQCKFITSISLTFFCCVVGGGPSARSLGFPSGALGFASGTLGFGFVAAANRSASSSSLPDAVKMSVVDADVVAPLIAILGVGVSSSANLGGSLS